MRRMWAAGAAVFMCLALGGLPALAQSPTPVPAGGVTIEVLSDRAVIPLEAIPASGALDALAHFSHVTIAPDASWTTGSSAPHAWAQVTYVERGTGTGSSNSKVRVWHQDGSVEDIPVGVEFASRAGETGLLFDGGAGGRFENGPEAYVELDLSIADGDDPAVEQAPIAGITSDLSVLAFIEPANREAWLSAPVAVTFQRVTLDPGASLVLEAEDIPMLTLTLVDSGAIRWGYSSAAETPPVVGPTTYWSTPPSGDPIIVSNAAEGPTVLLQAVLSPATE